jgi:hypothetical protein
MGNKTIDNPKQSIIQHEVALLELNKRTALLKNIADSNWTWLSPSYARPRVITLIHELVGYHKVLDRQKINQTPSDIDEARVAIFQALIASAETAEEQGSLTTLEWHFRTQLFTDAIDSIPGFKYEDVPAFMASNAQAKPEEKTTSILATIWSYLKNMVNSFFAMFAPKSTPQESEPILVVTNPPSFEIAYVAPGQAPTLDSKRQSCEPVNSSGSAHEKASRANLW